jgi:predicted RNA-binding protein with PIN domain
MLIIDGHNLIPKVPGLSLQAPDDEMRLVELLQRYCAHRNTRAEVYFDRAAAGNAGRRPFGAVTAVFVRSGRTADQAIAARVRQLGKQARNWVVVSSDREVQQAARWAGARVLTSEAFAAELSALNRSQPASEKPEKLTPDELDEWLRLFGEE